MLPQSREDEINSIVELIQSKQLYEKVVDAIGAERLLKPAWKPEGADGVGGPSIIDEIVGNAMGFLNQLWRFKTTCHYAKKP